MHRSILITGANKGIGHQIALEMIGKGWQVIATARDFVKLELAFLNPAENLTLLALDVEDNSTIDKVFTYLKNKEIYLDVLVNNAGMGIGNAGAIAGAIEEAKSIFNVNLFGAWQTTSILLPLIKKNEGASIINISSGMGALADLTGGYAGYRISKAALNALSILLSNELKKDKILVHAMCPGWCQTDMGGESAPRTALQGAETAVYLATQAALPTGRFWRDKKPTSW
jgi:NAD(P)-dependent dehydrogenase (short-subunit alcohol dehydrogenase family)